jgi:hypothetical protein
VEFFEKKCVSRSGKKIRISDKKIDLKKTKFFSKIGKKLD